MSNLKIFVFILATLLFIYSKRSVAQGLNHTFLLGYDIALFDTSVTSTKARLNFDSSSVTVIPETRKLAFEAAQANISDENGNLLISTNGCWIADASGDTMQNGSGLNPGPFATSWCSSQSGIPDLYSSVILPYPGDSTKYILFHQTANYSIPNAYSSELFYSIIDITMNGGLGAVTQKNIVAFNDSLNPGMTACKHANGRDWWVVIFKDNSDVIYKILLTPYGITSITTQHLGMPPHSNYNGQPQFSPDGTKFAYHHRFGVANSFTHEIRLFNFDRCTGMLTNGNLMSFADSITGFGLSFSPNSKYLYFSTFTKIFQLNTDTTNIPASKQLVATYDGYCYPDIGSCTDFWIMYLAANGKIYISSGSSTIDLNYINSPDSSGLMCDVQQHGLRTPCYIFRSNVNHPNYYLGPVIGSVCDTLVHVGLQQHENEVQNFKLSPNPSKDGVIKIIYLLPQNKQGIFEVYDLNGKIVYTNTLSPWSSLQYFNLSFLESGLYQCVIRSGSSISTQKLMVVK